MILGRVSGLFGVKGWVKVFSYTDPREALLDYDALLLKRDSHWQATRLAEGQRHGKTVIVRFDGCRDRDEAEKLLGCEIGISRDEMPEPDEGRYYWRDLEGLRVVRRDGTELGAVAYVMETGANDVLVLEGDKERLIPFVANDVILGVDLDKGEIRVDWEWD